MLLDTRCLQSAPYFTIALLPQFSTLSCHDFHQILFCPIPIHAWVKFISLTCFIYWKGLTVDYIFLISFKVAFTQDVFTSAGNMETSKNSWALL